MKKDKLYTLEEAQNKGSDIIIKSAERLKKSLSSSFGVKRRIQGY